MHVCGSECERFSLVWFHMKLRHDNRAWTGRQIQWVVRESRLERGLLGGHMDVFS